MLPAQPPEMTKNVQTAFVAQGGVVQPLRLTGTAEAVIESTLASEQQGVVEVMAVDEGDAVSTGTVLLSLRREPLRLSRDAAKANLDAENARLTELKTGTRPEDITIARNEYESAQVGFEVSEREFKRFQTLFDSRSVSENELDQARNTFEAARARLQSAKAAYDLATQGPRIEEIAAQEARVAVAQANFALLQDNFERAEIRAPYAGIITRRHVNIGTWVADGDPVFDLVTLDRMRIRAMVPEQEFNTIRPGAVATISFDAAPEIVKELPVSRVIAAADSQSRTFPILINVRNTTGEYAPGMLARVEFKRPIDGRTKVVPKDALVAQGPVPVLFKVDTRDGVPHAKRLEVKTGRFFGEAVEVITEDLKAGDQVVIRGNERLMDGDKLAVNVFVTTPGKYAAEQSKFFTEPEQ